MAHVVVPRTHRARVSPWVAQGQPWVVTDDPPWISQKAQHVVTRKNFCALQQFLQTTLNPQPNAEWHHLPRPLVSICAGAHAQAVSALTDKHLMTGMLPPPPIVKLGPALFPL